MTAAETRRTAITLVTALLDRLRTTDVRELEVREAGVRVRVSRDGAPAPAASAAPVAAPGTPEPAAVPAKRAAAAPAKAIEVTAPLTGIFYRSASPQAPSFVQLGSAVAVGDVVGLIEAMKLFNEVRSTVAGRVKRVVAENGQLVRAHQPLFELE